MLKELDTSKLYTIYVNTIDFSNCLLNFKNENEFGKLKYFLECLNCHCQWIRGAFNVWDCRFKNCWSLTFYIFYLQKLIGEVFNIVSQQSTARPGCIIELDAITNQVKICLWIGDNILYPGVLYMHVICLILTIILLFDM